MPTSSPGFVGSRLREAREVRQLTAVSLAEMVDVTPATVSAYENGHWTPSPEVLAKITETLNFRTEFFFRPGIRLEDTRQTIFERSKSSTTKSTRRRAQHQRTWLREILQYLDQFVTLPAPNFPPDGLDWSRLEDEAIEESARRTRRHWNLGDGPISNVTLLAEKNGIIVTMVPMNARDLSAFSTLDHDDQRPYIVLGTDIPSPFRTRFNVCHELGHLVLHRTVTPLEFQDQRYFKMIESQADRFAAALLTPASTFSPDITAPTLDVFRTLKPRWRTSIKMMVYRAQELNIIDREEARRLYINYNRRGWNRGEPLDRETEVEKPRLVRRVFEAIIDNDVLERSQIVAALPFNREDIEQLANLPHGYLDEESAYNQAIRDLEGLFQ
ncbi:MAG: XRE family transcriptional regulator [Chloroflexi bacterium]|nr:XRE family transcriptional regulator [Chloroflexota bacterium]